MERDASTVRAVPGFSLFLTTHFYNGDEFLFANSFHLFAGNYVLLSRRDIGCKETWGGAGVSKEMPPGLEQVHG